MLRTPVVCCALALLSTLCAAQQSKPIEIRVDLSDAPRHLVHVTEQLPAHAGVNSYSYPQWIPSQELPGGAIDNLAGLFFHAGTLDGPTLKWRRNLDDPFAFNVTVPEGTTVVNASFDVLEVPSRANTIGSNRTSSHVVMLEPSDVVLYPTHQPVHDLDVTASYHLPKGWQAATALRTNASDAPALNGQDATFKTVSMEKFVDSPLLAGDHCRQYPIAPEVHPIHTLDVCAEKDADLELDKRFLDNMNRLVRQAGKVFLSHHYDHYDFLIADSPHIEGDSMEHTESADYVVRSLDMSDPNIARFDSYLLPHEFVHSWCGKYRRPAGVATAEYHTPMENDLLWVYEGLTEYYGDVLAARAKFRTPEQALMAFDQSTYQLDQPGRVWRSVQDTADASAILRGNDTAWSNWRLSQDYYPAGALLWLETDVKIRKLTDGKRSLDDFAAKFFGLTTPGGPMKDTGPGILPYSFTDVVTALNETAPYDWSAYWTSRLNLLDRNPPTAGLEAAGYKYVDAAKMVEDEATFMNAMHAAELLHSLGIFVMGDGTVRDVWMKSPAFEAGLGPGDKITQIDGKPYSADALREAIRRAKNSSERIRLTAVRDDEEKVFILNYHGGERYAALERNKNKDLLTTEILQPR